MITIQFQCETSDEAKTYINAPDAKCRAQEFREHLRSMIKHGEHSTETMADLLSLQEYFYDVMGEYL